MNTPTQSPAVATHTPTPWYDESTNRSSANIVSADHVIAYVYDRNDRAFIVRACNSHAQLVAALEETERNATWNDDDTVTILRARLDELSDYARAALQSAKK